MRREIGTLGRARTANLWFRKPMPCPVGRREYEMATSEGLEPPTFYFVGRCSNPVELRGHNGATGGNRTLVPTLARSSSTIELRSHGAEYGTRTHLVSLEGWCPAHGPIPQYGGWGVESNSHCLQAPILQTGRWTTSIPPMNLISY